MDPFRDDLRKTQTNNLEIQRRRLFERWCKKQTLLFIHCDRQESRANILAIHLRMRTPAEFLTKHFAINFN